MVRPITTQQDILLATDTMTRGLRKLKFSAPITHVYNPLDYAREAWATYVEKYAAPCEVVFLGMNPGPFGMAQTGVPFGEVAAVRDWMGIEVPVGRPSLEHPKRLIQGFACERSEVSGRRLWGWAQERFKTPKQFFSRCFVLNYCPLVFMEESGKNFTPDKLKAKEQHLLFEICDEALREMLKALQVKWVIGVGDFAAGRARETLLGSTIQVGRVLHPSPANPHANKGWAAAADKQLIQQGIVL